MARSRRKQKEPKCICGRPLTRFKYHNRVRSECTILHYADERNEEFMKYRERRSLPLIEED